MKEIKYYKIERLNESNGYAASSNTISVTTASLVMQADSIFDASSELKILKKVVIPETGELVLFVKSRISLDITDEFVNLCLSELHEY